MKYIENIDIERIIYKINKIKNESLIEIRSVIINELLISRIDKILNSIRMNENEIELPQHYLDQFRNGLFEYKLVEEEYVINKYSFNIPLLDLRLAAKQLLAISYPFEKGKAELYELFNDKGISEETIKEEVLSQVYDFDSYEFVNVEEDLRYPLIILNDDFVVKYRLLLKYYYNLFNNPNFTNSENGIKIKLVNDKINEIDIEMEYNWRMYSDPYLHNEFISYSTFEVIINLERRLVYEFIKDFNILQMLNIMDLSQSSIESIIEDSFDNILINNLVLDIDRRIQNVENIIFKRRAELAEGKEKAYKVVLEEDYLKELAKTTKKKYGLQGKKKSAVVFYLEELIEHRDSISSNYVSSSTKIIRYVDKYNPKKNKGHGSKTAILNFFNKHRKIIASLYNYDENKITDTIAYSLLQQKDITKFKKLII